MEKKEEMGRKQIQSLKHALEIKDKALTASQKKEGQLTKNSQQNWEEIKKLEQSFLEKQRELEALKKENDTDQRKIRDLDAACKKTQKENDVLNTKLKEIQRKLEEENQKLKREIDTLTHRLTEAEKGFKNTAVQLKGKQSEIEKLREMLENEREGKSLVELNQKNLEGEIANTKRDYEVYRQTTQKRLEQIDLTKECSLKEQKKELQKKEQSLKSIEQELKEKVEKAKRRQKALNILELELINKSELLEKQASSHSSILEERTNAIIKEKQEFDALKIEKEERLSQLEQDLKRKEQLLHQKDSEEKSVLFQKQRAANIEDLKKRNSEIEQLKEEIKRRKEKEEGDTRSAQQLREEVGLQKEKNFTLQSIIETLKQRKKENEELAEQENIAREQELNLKNVELDGLQIEGENLREDLRLMNQLLEKERIEKEEIQKSLMSQLEEVRDELETKKKELERQNSQLQGLVEMKSSFEFDGSFDPDVSRDEAAAALELQKSSALSKFIMKSPHQSEKVVRQRGLENFEDLQYKLLEAQERIENQRRELKDEKEQRMREFNLKKTAQKAVVRCQESIKKLEEQLKNSQIEIDELSSQKEKHSGFLSTSPGESIGAKNELLSLRSKLEIKEQELAINKKCLKVANQSNNEQEEKISQLTQKLKKSQSQLRQKEKQIEGLISPEGGSKSMSKLAIQKQREIMKLKMTLQDKKNENQFLKSYRSDSGSLINSNQFRRQIESDILSKESVSNLKTEINRSKMFGSKLPSQHSFCQPIKNTPVRAVQDLNQPSTGSTYKSRTTVGKKYFDVSSFDRERLTPDINFLPAVDFAVQKDKRQSYLQPNQRAKLSDYLIKRPPSCESRDEAKIQSPRVGTPSEMIQSPVKRILPVRSVKKR